MKRYSNHLLAAVAALAFGALSGTSAHAQGTFTPGIATSPTNCDLGSGGSTASTKTCTTGAVSVTMEAWGFTDNALGSSAQAGFTKGLLADWDSNGFGAYTGSNEDTGTTQHTFDSITTGCNAAVQNAGLSTKNSGCGGSIEALYMSFNNKVNLTNVGIGFKGVDADLSVWAWTGGGTGPTMATQTASGSTTTSGTTAAAMAGWTLINSFDMSTNSSGATPQTAVGGSIFSSYFLITTYFGAANAAAGLTAGNDEFKVNSFTASLCSGTVSSSGACSGSATPEPTSLALVAIAGLGALGARRRLIKAVTA